MQGGDAGHDGQAQAAARHVAGVQAVKALEYALAFGLGNAGAAIGKPQPCRIGIAHDAQAQAAALRRVTDGVVEQVADQHAQPFALAENATARLGAEIEVEVTGEDRATEFGADAFHQRAQIEFFRRRQAALGVEPGQQQHLLDQMGGTRQADLQLSERTLALFVIARLQGDLCLRLQGGERGTQLVGGIGGKAALGVQGLLDAGQQTVERLQQRPDFIRRTGGNNGLQLCRMAAGNLAGEGIERRQPAPGGQPGTETDHGQAE